MLTLVPELSGLKKEVIAGKNDQSNKYKQTRHQRTGVQTGPHAYSWMVSLGAWLRGLIGGHGWVVLLGAMVGWFYWGPWLDGFLNAKFCCIQSCLFQSTNRSLLHYV